MEQVITGNMYNIAGYTIRQLLIKDINSALIIEKLSFDTPWTVKEFLKYLETYDNNGNVNNYITLAVETDKKLVGYIICDVLSNKIRILNVAIHPDHRLKGILTSFIAKIIHLAQRKQKKQVIIEIKENNLSAQLAFKALEFKAIKIIKNGGDYNTYLMSKSVITNSFNNQFHAKNLTIHHNQIF